MNCLTRWKWLSIPPNKRCKQHQQKPNHLNSIAHRMNVRSFHRLHSNIKIRKRKNHCSGNYELKRINWALVLCVRVHSLYRLIVLKTFLFWLYAKYYAKRFLQNDHHYRLVELKRCCYIASFQFSRRFVAWTVNTHTHTHASNLFILFFFFSIDDK